MFTCQPLELHDRLLDSVDEVFADLQAIYPWLDLAIGEENFTELRDGLAENTYDLTLITPSLRACEEIKTYSYAIIPSLENIDSSALESFSVVYEVYNKSSDEYEEQVYFTHNFKENN